MPFELCGPLISGVANGLFVLSIFVVAVPFKGIEERAADVVVKVSPLVSLAVEEFDIRSDALLSSCPDVTLSGSSNVLLATPIDIIGINVFATFL